MKSRAAWLVVTAIPATFLAVFFLYPVGTMLWTGLRFDGRRDPLDVVVDPSVLRVLWFTFWQAAVSTAITVAVALPAAHVFARYRFRGKSLARALITVPFVMPTVVVASAFLSVSSRLGLEDGAIRLRHTVWAILLAHVFFNYAVIVRSVGGFWAQLDPRSEEAARVLGASRLRAFREVTLPQLLPAIASAAAIVFLFSFTSFGVILILGGPRRATLETEVWRYATQRVEFDVAAVLALMQMVVVVALVVINGALQRRRSRGLRMAAAHVVERRAVTGGERLFLGGVFLSALALLGAPIALLVERSLRSADGYSLRHYTSLFDEGDRFRALTVAPIEAVGNSLWFASVATVIAGIIGLLAALVVVHGSGRVSVLFDVGFLLPLGTSAVTLGFGFLIALDERPLDLRTSWIIIPLAHAIVGIPFVMRSIVPVMRSVEHRLREAAAVLGAAPARVRREIDLPIASRGLLIGAAFAFAVSLGEFGATSFIARPGRPTVPWAIFTLLGRPGEAGFGQALALSVILMAMTATAVLVIEHLRFGRLSEF